MSYTEEMQKIANRYMKSGQPWPATSRDIAHWAITSGLWEPSRSSLVDQCADQIARAMREEYIRDPQGRSVRAKHAARILVHGEQQTFWGDMRTAGRDHMEIAFQQRRQQILGDCRQLKVDADSFNENVNEEAPLQMCFDFTLDLEEMEALQHRKSA